MANAPARRIELDLLRGFAVAGMILVISPGDWAMTYGPLQHAAWHGWTLGDMVFPAFLFSVGVALGLSFPRDVRGGFWRRVLRRVGLLILIGLLLEYTFNLSVGVFGGAIGKAGIENLRIPGVLQRIALCYLLAALVVVGTGRRAGTRVSMRPEAVAGVIAALLVGYWVLLTFVPVPGFGAGRLDPECNLGAYLDRAIFTPAHLWAMGWKDWGGPIVYDPEGLLSTLPALGNVLFGVLAADVWQRRGSGAAWAIGLASLALMIAGLLLDPIFPINKRIWTSSFALLSSGFAGLVLAALILVMRGRTRAGVLAPLGILGGNAILAYVLCQLIGRVADMPILAAGGEMVAPRTWFNSAVLGLAGEPYLASFICAVLTVVAITLMLWPLHRRDVHVRL